MTSREHGRQCGFNLAHCHDPEDHKRWRLETFGLPPPKHPTLSDSELVTLKLSTAHHVLALKKLLNKAKAGRYKKKRPSELAMEIADVQMLFDKLSQFVAELDAYQLSKMKMNKE